MRKIAFITFILFAICSCSPRLTSKYTSTLTALDASDEVLVVSENTQIPEAAQFLGTLKVGDTGFTTPNNGTTEKVMELAREEARKNGGNVVKITKSIPPDFNCTTHRIEAMIYHLDDLSLIVEEEDNIQLVNPAHPDYAVVYLYRSNSSVGSLLSYDVYANETKVYHCSRNTKAEVKIYEPCNVSFWAKTEGKAELPLQIRLGEEYYIECSVTLGAFVGRPMFHLIDPRIGYNAYNSIQK